MSETRTSWIENVIKKEEYEEYLDEEGNDFIDDDLIWKQINSNKDPDPSEIRRIIQKSLRIETLAPEETAKLLNVKDPKLLKEMEEAAGEVKRRVYDNRIVFFAPLYLSNYCVNNCTYCGFRVDNTHEQRSKLNLDQVRAETEVLAGKIGHKRLIVVYGEHPSSEINYMEDTIKTIYNVTVPTKHGTGQIRRVNVNCAPLSVDDLIRLKNVGIGTYQVFQETYHHDTYDKVHPKGTLKNDYKWRLYCHHRAQKAGIDDVAIGALFGLYDWRFEVMAMLYHAIDLERRYLNIGPHTISFPRLNPADNAPYTLESKYRVSDEDFKKLIVILRLSIPYSGMIITARETAQLRRECIPLGITQTDASTQIGIGSYSASDKVQDLSKQQFLIGDPREMDLVVRELAEMGYITSFCTAGYRCGRTGGKIMDLLRTGREGHFCKLNAVLTFKEYLDDFASPETKKIGEELIKKEMQQVRKRVPQDFSEELVTTYENYFSRISKGERDLYI